MSDAGRRRLTHLMARGCAFLGTEYAILGGAMSWVSERNLVAAISNAGGFGVIACGAMTPALLDAEIIREVLAAPHEKDTVTLCVDRNLDNPQIGRAHV